MTKLIIKLGGNMLKDIKDAYENPRKELAGTHTIYLKGSENIYSVLSPKRIELFQYLLKNKKQKKTVGQIAHALKRKQEAISRDNALLEEIGLIKKEKHGRKTFLSTQIKSISIELI
ncbi:MAG: hypothetical protein ABIA76_02005 [Candidatus Diapherotrites archaeon]